MGKVVAELLALTRKSDYALVALAGLADAPEQAQSATELAETLSLPLPVLRNILKRLALAGLLSSSQGSSGGYRLALPATAITLEDVVTAIEGPVRLAPCCSMDPSASCRREDSCRIKAAVQGVHVRIRRLLSETTIAELTHDVGKPADSGLLTTRTSIQQG